MVGSGGVAMPTGSIVLSGRGSVAGMGSVSGALFFVLVRDLRGTSVRRTLPGLGLPGHPTPVAILRTKICGGQAVRGPLGNSGPPTKLHA